MIYPPSKRPLKSNDMNYQYIKNEDSIETLKKKLTKKKYESMSINLISRDQDKIIFLTTVKKQVRRVLSRYLEHRDSLIYRIDNGLDKKSTNFNLNELYFLRKSLLSKLIVNEDFSNVNSLVSNVNNVEFGDENRKLLYLEQYQLKIWYTLLVQSEVKKILAILYHRNLKIQGYDKILRIPDSFLNENYLSKVVYKNITHFKLNKLSSFKSTEENWTFLPRLFKGRQKINLNLEDKNYIFVIQSNYIRNITRLNNIYDDSFKVLNNDETLYNNTKDTLNNSHLLSQFQISLISSLMVQLKFLSLDRIDTKNLLNYFNKLNFWFQSRSKDNLSQHPVELTNYYQPFNKNLLHRSKIIYLLTNYINTIYKSDRNLTHHSNNIEKLLATTFHLDIIKFDNNIMNITNKSGKLHFLLSISNSNCLLPPIKTHIFKSKDTSIVLKPLQKIDECGRLFLIDKSLRHKISYFFIKDVLVGQSEFKSLFLKSYFNLVTLMSKNMHFYNKHIPLEDLIQEGMIGLISSLNRFQVDYGYVFKTYAHFWIRQGIQRGLNFHKNIVRIPSNKLKLINKVRYTSNKIETQQGRKATVEEISAEAKISISKTKKVLSSPPIKPISMDSTLLLGEVPLIHQLEGKDKSKEKSNHNTLTYNDFISNWFLINPGKHTLLSMRFGIYPYQSHTEQRLSDMFGISTKEIQQIILKQMSFIQNDSTSIKG